MVYIYDNFSNHNGLCGSDNNKCGGEYIYLQKGLDFINVYWYNNINKFDIINKEIRKKKVQTL